jgi:hypothetical protein
VLVGLGDPEVGLGGDRSGLALELLPRKVGREAALEQSGVEPGAGIRADPEASVLVERLELVQLLESLEPEDSVQLSGLGRERSPEADGRSRLAQLRPTRGAREEITNDGDLDGLAGAHGANLLCRLPAY